MMIAQWSPFLWTRHGYPVFMLGGYGANSSYGGYMNTDHYGAQSMKEGGGFIPNEADPSTPVKV